MVSWTLRMSSDIGPILRGAPAVAQAGHPRCECPHEAGSAHLAVADHVEPGLFLVEDCSIDGVVEGLLDVDRPEAAGLHQLLGGIEPRRVGIAADDGRRQQRQTCWHAVERTPRETGQAIAVPNNAPIP